MQIRSIRRLTNDSNHNAFTGACFFKGALYVAFRQGDSHAEEQGRLIVMRSRDEGVSFDLVHVARGDGDTRDAHLYTDGKRLFVVGFVSGGKGRCSGTAYTENGLNWSPWTPFKSADGFVLWRPVFFNGKFYAAGYNYADKGLGVAWFESGNGLTWRLKRWLRKASTEGPNESAFAFKPDGSVAMLMRRRQPNLQPVLLRSKPPYTKWSSKELKLSLGGPMIWWVDDELWIAGRWISKPRVANLAIFKMIGDRPELELVMPSGPEFDCSYMSVAPHPTQRGRFFFSYYSNHVAPDDPAISQWHHPDIYLADVHFGGVYIADWKVSALQGGKSLDDAHHPGDAKLTGWTTLKAIPRNQIAGGFVSAKNLINKQAGVITFVSDVEVGPCDGGTLYLGYDGPLRVWLNGEEVFRGIGTNPAVPDKIAVPVRLRHGRNRLAIALDTNDGRAAGIFARIEAQAIAAKKTKRRA